MQNQLKIFTDGGSRGNPGPAAAAFVALSATDQPVYQEGHFLGVTTNNQAEYRAVIFALNWLNNTKYSVVNFFLDSQLVVNQINGIFRIKDPALKIHLDNIRQFQISNLSAGRQDFKFQITFTYVPRAQNFRADALVNSTLDAALGK